VAQPAIVAQFDHGYEENRKIRPISLEKNL